jgi:hypothetical protein
MNVSYHQRQGKQTMQVAPEFQLLLLLLLLPQSAAVQSGLWLLSSGPTGSPWQLQGLLQQVDQVAAGCQASRTTEGALETLQQGACGPQH